VSASVVMITGALSGIGRAAAAAFAKAGHRVVVSDVRQDAGEALADELASLGAAAEFIQADVANEDSVRHLVDRTIERFGHLDIAINSAGDTATFETEALGVRLSMKHELRVMRTRGSGSIVNIASGMGGRRASLESLTKSAAIEAAVFGVRVNAVAAGRMATTTRDRAPGQRPAFLAAEEIAETIVFVASNKASYITGQIIRVTGGKIARRPDPPDGERGSLRPYRDRFATRAMVSLDA
jgi:NAD(P)-dependent dehydrogenase (short-subunit alcohol dehydrogenase family)